MKRKSGACRRKEDAEKRAKLEDMLASTAKICRFFKPVDFQHSDNFEIDDEFSDLDSELEQDRISAPMLSTTELSIDIAVSSSEESSEKFCDTMKDKRIPVPEIPGKLSVYHLS